MKKFEKPIAEMIAMDVANIITTSPMDGDDEWSSSSDVEWSE